MTFVIRFAQCPCISLKTGERSSTKVRPQFVDLHRQLLVIEIHSPTDIDQFLDLSVLSTDPELSAIGSAQQGLPISRVR